MPELFGSFAVEREVPAGAPHCRAFQAYHTSDGAKVKPVLVRLYPRESLGEDDEAALPRRAAIKRQRAIGERKARRVARVYKPDGSESPKLSAAGVDDRGIWYVTENLKISLGAALANFSYGEAEIRALTGEILAGLAEIKRLSEDKGTFGSSPDYPLGPANIWFRGHPKELRLVLDELGPARADAAAMESGDLQAVAAVIYQLVHGTEADLFSNLPLAPGREWEALTALRLGGRQLNREQALFWFGLCNELCGFDPGGDGLRPARLSLEEVAKRIPARGQRKWAVGVVAALAGLMLAAAITGALAGWLPTHRDHHPNPREADIEDPAKQTAQAVAPPSKPDVAPTPPAAATNVPDEIKPGAGNLKEPSAVGAKESLSTPAAASEAPPPPPSAAPETLVATPVQTNYELLEGEKTNLQVRVSSTAPGQNQSLKFEVEARRASAYLDRTNGSVTNGVASVAFTAPAIGGQSFDLQFALTAPQAKTNVSVKVRVLTNRPPQISGLTSGVFEVTNGQPRELTFEATGPKGRRVEIKARLVESGPLEVLVPNPTNALIRLRATNQTVWSGEIRVEASDGVRSNSATVAVKAWPAIVPVRISEVSLSEVQLRPGGRTNIDLTVAPPSAALSFSPTNPPGLSLPKTQLIASNKWQVTLEAADDLRSTNFAMRITASMPGSTDSEEIKVFLTNAPPKIQLLPDRLSLKTNETASVHFQIEDELPEKVMVTPSLGEAARKLGLSVTVPASDKARLQVSAGSEAGTNKVEISASDRVSEDKSILTVIVTNALPPSPPAAPLPAAEAVSRLSPAPPLDLTISLPGFEPGLAFKWVANLPGGGNYPDQPQPGGWIGEHELRQGEFAAALTFLKTNSSSTEQWLFNSKNAITSDYANEPVTNIDWYSADLFCKALTRLVKTNHSRLIPEGWAFQLPNTNQWTHFADKTLTGDATNAFGLVNLINVVAQWTTTIARDDRGKKTYLAVGIGRNYRIGGGDPGESGKRGWSGDGLIKTGVRLILAPEPSQAH